MFINIKFNKYMQIIIINKLELDKYILINIY